MEANTINRTKQQFPGKTHKESKSTNTTQNNAPVSRQEWK